MLWTEVRKWAKNLGYETIKDKEDDQYYWAKLDAPEASGVEKSVSKLAKAIYNHYTNNIWIEHQKDYINNKELNQISVSDYGT